MKRLQTRVPGSLAKIRLDYFLSDWLPRALDRQISKSLIRTLILSGAVYINRHRNKNATTPVYSGAIVEVYFDEDRLFQNQPIRMQDYHFDAGRVLFEDEWLIIVDKPDGLPTQPTLDPNRANLFDVIKKHLNYREKTTNAYVGLHHRLDKDTSGIVLFTKKEEINKGISDLFLEHKIQKTYHCLVWRSPGSPVYEVGEEFTIKNNLGKVGERSGKAMHGAVKSGGDVAITHFQVVEIFRNAYWMQALPQTGRTHQIRVHTSENGLPILGDDLYFPEGILALVEAPRLMLHASRLEFIHPITQKPIQVVSEVPVEFVQVLGQLKT